MNHQCVNVCFGELLAERRHFAAAAAPVHYEFEDALVADARLPRRVRQITGAIELGFERFCSPVFAVTGGAVFIIDCLFPEENDSA